MKKARLILTSFEYYFSQKYGCCPEIYYDRLCQSMESRQAAEYLNNEIIPKTWENYVKYEKRNVELRKKGFKLLKDGKGVPFTAT